MDGISLDIKNHPGSHNLMPNIISSPSGVNISIQIVYK
jgi:hypothetical protein